MISVVQSRICNYVFKGGMNVDLKVVQKQNSRRSSLRLVAAYIRFSIQECNEHGMHFLLLLVREWFNRKIRSRYGRPVRQFKFKGCNQPIFFRSCSSDPRVIRQLWLNHELVGCTSLGNLSLIVDCGGNIGLATLYLLQYYPDAKFIVVESDLSNISICKLNLENYQDQVTIHNAGIWSHAVPLKIYRGEAGEFEEWELEVRPCNPGEIPDVNGIDLNTLLQESGEERISLLKIDIEGAEEMLFAENWRYWLDRTDNLAIELHNEQSKTVFENVMQNYEYERVTTGEYVLCKGIKRLHDRDKSS